MRRSGETQASALLLGFLLLAACSKERIPTNPDPTLPSSSPPPSTLDRTAVFPLALSANQRYLVDQQGHPFLIAGDAPQALTVQLSLAEAELYFSTRRAQGFNAVWINLLCRQSFTGRSNGSTYDGIVPFTTANDLATPNEAYFARCDQMIALAANHNLLVILDPIETIDHLGIMVNNGPTKCRNFGRYLGNRYRHFDNIVWMSGNDYQTWPQQDDVVTAVALGIQETDPVHIHTVLLNYYTSGSLDDVNWHPIIRLNASYTYYPTYIQVLTDYNRATSMPVFLAESTYEFEYGSTPTTLRRQQYWALLSGATGQVYGNYYIWPFRSGWQQNLQSPGALQMIHMQRLFESRPWHQLVPDQTHSLVTGGYGTYANNTLFQMNSDYVTAARTGDGRLGMAYLPSSRTITVDMTRISGGSAKAWWYNPTNGQATLIGTFPTTGSVNFTPSSSGDWVLVLDDATLGLGPPGSPAQNAPPFVAAPAAASPNPVPGVSTALSVLGADDGGEASLTYTWSTTGSPPAPVSFQPNGTNAAKNCAATFTKAGTYSLRATITDAGGLTATSDLTVTVSQTLTTIAVTPAAATVFVGGTQQFAAMARDQFGDALATQPSFAWTVSGGGTISSTGLFTAGNAPGGPHTVTAASGGKSGTASVTVTAANTVQIGQRNVLPVDDQGRANLLVAQPATLSQIATIQSLSFYVSSPHGKLRLGIYDATGPSGGPGAKRAETAEITPVAGWNTAPVLSPVSLPPGTYWLAFLPNSNSMRPRRGSYGACRYHSFPYGSLPATFGTATTSLNDHWSFYGTLVPAGGGNAPPSVSTPAAASPNPVPGVSTALSVLGADDGGEASLTYTWSTTGSPPAPVSFQPNGTNAAKNCTATFTKAGTYSLRATITDAGGLAATSDLTVTVSQTLTTIAVTPAAATVFVGGTQQFAAMARDQFGDALATQPSFTWTVSGGGTISSGGLFTAGGTPGGPFTVRAASGGKSGTASVTVTAATTIRIGQTNILPVDDHGRSNLLIAQPATLSQTATIQSLSLYITAASGKLRLGIYDATGPSGGPGAKKAETAEINPIIGWNTAPVLSPVSLPPGTYWLAFLPNSNSLRPRRGSYGSCRYRSFTYGPLPATFGTATTSLNDHWSFYGTLQP